MYCRSVAHRTPALFIRVGLFGAAPLAFLPSAGADVVAYLVNVTVRPGYNFANADHALSYGHGICDKVSGGQTYVDVMSQVKADFATSNEYQASYLINQTVNELRPTLIWQLRNSATHYRPATADG